MKKFVLTILLFGACFFVYDKLFIPLLSYCPTCEADQRIQYILDGKMNKEVIILGSSRGGRDIIASQLQEETGLSAYNLSFPGADIEFQEFILRSLLKFNHPPEMIILTVDDSLEFIESDRVKFRYEYLYPYVGNDHVLNELIVRKDRHAWLTDVLVLSRMSRSNFNLAKRKFTPYDSVMACGSMPVSIHEDTGFKYEIHNHYNSKYEVDSKISAFQKLIGMCQENNIKLVIAFPPNFQSFNTTFEKRIEQLTGKRAHYYVYNINDPAYRDNSYFSDSRHLIFKGARLFTSELSGYVKKLLNKDSTNTHPGIAKGIAGK